MNSLAIGIPFVELQSVDSTNNYAMRQVHAGLAQHGFTVLAHEQTAGKGQRNKVWLAETGVNVMMSIVIKPPKGLPSPIFGFSMAMAVAAYGLLKKFAPEIKIKWPNDIYLRDRKAGGILIENNWVGNSWKFAIAGFGLNINQTDFGELNSKATSLKQQTGNDYNVIELAKSLCNEIDAVLKKLDVAPDKVYTSYQQQLYKKNEWVKFKKGLRIFEAQIIGVNEVGQLVVQHAVEETFNVGEVEWLL